jgi:hypothetical protein
MQRWRLLSKTCRNVIQGIFGPLQVVVSVWPMKLSGKRPKASHLCRNADSGFVVQRTQMPGPYPLTYRVGPSASCARFFTDQKLWDNRH